MIVPTGEIIHAAVAARRGVGAFNVIQLEHAEALVAGAEAARSPVILQISENTVRYHGALKPLALATLAIASSSTVDVAVHLDHATDADLVHEAIDLGFGSVMYDASILSYLDNVSATAAITKHCHAHGIFVEAELGEVGGKNGVHTPGTRTDPHDARRYVSATSVDALAVAVGTSHAMPTRTAHLDLDLITHLHAAVPVPLVLHGSSGVPDKDLTRAIAAGITKVNIATHLNRAFTTAIRDHLDTHPDTMDTRKYLRPARDAVTAETTRMLRLLSNELSPSDPSIHSPGQI